MDFSTLNDAEMQSYLFRCMGEFNTGVETLRKGMVMFPNETIHANFLYLQDATQKLENAQEEMITRMKEQNREARRRQMGMWMEEDDESA